jgi:two-component system NtrC family sensor kinase
VDSARSRHASRGKGSPSPRGATVAGPDLERFSSGLDRFPDPILIADNRKRILFLNRAATELLGCPAAAPGERPLCTDLLRVEMAGGLHCFVERCLERREHLHGVPVRIQGRQGSWHTILVTASYIQDRDGNPAGCFAVLREMPADRPASSPKATPADAMKGPPNPRFLVNADLVITQMNEALEELSGYTSSEAVGKMTCGQLLSTNFCNTGECLLKRAMAAGRPVCGVRQVIRDHTGQQVPIHATAFVITDVEGHFAGGVELDCNMTPSGHVGRLLELLIEMSQDGILIVDDDGRITRANAAMAAITGRPREELVGLDIGELFPPQHVENLRFLAHKLDEEKNQSQPMRFLSTIPRAGAREKRYGVFDTSLVVSRLGDRVVTYIYLHDVSERITIEAELRKANNFLTNIIQSSVDGIVVVDVKGQVLIFNQGAESILGYSAAEVKGDPTIMRRIFKADLARELMRRIRSGEYGSPGKLNPTRLTFTRKDGQEVPVTFSAAIVTDGGEEIASVGIFSDRTERVRLRRELEEAQRQLVQAEKIGSLGRLAAGVAHEINNPLAGILIYAETLMREVGDRPQWREDLQEIITQTLRCKQIVTRLLEFSRQSVGERVLFDLNEPVRRCVELLGRQSLFHDIEIVLDLESELPQIVGDPGELRQVCTNVMINAADAMLGKGRLTIRTHSLPQSEQVVLEFADTGPGIDPKLKDKIFEPFFTTKAPRGGTGLGLSIVYGIIQRHKGSIEVTSPAAVGATFTIKLPLQAPSEESETAKA